MIEVGPPWTTVLNRNQNLLGKVMIALIRPSRTLLDPGRLAAAIRAALRIEKPGRPSASLQVGSRMIGAMNPSGRMAATTCAALLFALAFVAWVAQAGAGGELGPGLQLLGAAAATWATATVVGLFGPAPVERVVLAVLALSMAGLLAGGGWVLVGAVS